MTISTRLLASMSALLVVQLALASEPVAIIEEIDAPGNTLQFMDYVTAGDVIDLGASGKIVLGYLRSCVRETVVSGRITVGRNKSQVQDGQVERKIVECDGGNLQLSAEQAANSATTMFRNLNPVAKSELKPSVRVFGTSPVIKLPPENYEISIQRVDGKGSRYNMSSSGNVVDLLERNIVLTPGGIYQVQSGDKSIVFKVALSAKRGSIPIVSRLVRF